MVKVTLATLSQLTLCVMLACADDAPVPVPIAISEASAANDEGGDCCGEEIPPNVLARVNDSVITKEEVDQAIQPLLNRLSHYLVAARQKQLEMLINGLLLEQEARQRGVDSEELLRQEVLSQVGDPTEADVVAFFNENRERFEGELSESKEKIKLYLTSLRQSEKAKQLADGLRKTGQFEELVQDQTLAELEADPSQVVAKVGDTAIRLGKVDRDLTPLLATIQDQAYRLRKQSIDQAINTELIQQEAEKRQVAVESLLKKEVISKVGPISEKEVLEYYAKYHDQLDLDIELPESREKIARQIGWVRIEQARASYAQQLRGTAELEIYLAAPRQPTLNVNIDNRPVKGSAEAPVTVVVFLDYECKRCAELHKTLLQLVDEFDKQVKLVIRDFPVSHHPRAFMAAVAAEAAGQQGRYWEYASLLFENQEALELEHLKRYASDLGLDRVQFDAALESEELSQKVRLERADALRLGVRSTPILLIDGKPIEDRSHASLKHEIQDALNYSSTTAAQQTTAALNTP